MIQARNGAVPGRVVPYRLAAIAVAIAIAGGTSACRSAPIPQPFEADRVDVRIDLHADGSIDVRERIEGRPSSAQRRFVRSLESHRADAIAVQSMALDGRALPLETLNVRVRETPAALRAEWPLADGDQTAHVFELHYRALGVLSIDDNRGRLVWPILQGVEGFPVRHATVRLELDAPGEILRGTGMAEAGWTVERVERGLSATRTDVGRETVTLLAEVSVNTQVVKLPEWQVTADLRDEFSLAFISGALFVLVVGAGVIVIVRVQHPPRGRAAGSTLDRDREYAVSGLTKTAMVGTVFSMACAAAAHFTLPRFGWWVQLIPAAMLLVSLAFGMAAAWMRRRV